MISVISIISTISLSVLLVLLALEDRDVVYRAAQEGGRCTGSGGGEVRG